MQTNNFYEFSYSMLLCGISNIVLRVNLMHTNDVWLLFQITELPYLHMVVSEVLRMYPIIPFLDRIPEKDYNFPGTKLVIKKGSPVMLPMRALHMDPKYFPNPEAFDPERFSVENKSKIIPYTYFPFGTGPRACVGKLFPGVSAKFYIKSVTFTLNSRIP